MEHQTFEDEDAAEFINEHFVSIKVDREERPDVDAAYMHAVQIMTGRGVGLSTASHCQTAAPFLAEPTSLRTLLLKSSALSYL